MCSMKKGVLRNFAKFKEKHLCQSFFFDKVASVRINKNLELSIKNVKNKCVETRSF